MITGSAQRGGASVPVVNRRRSYVWWPLDFYSTAVGKKAVMAVTGIILLGFVLLHMLGNLKLYQGAEHMNAYGEWLRTVGSPAVPNKGTLWAVRVILIVAFALHIHAAASLTLMNRRARPVGYQGPRKYTAADYAARTMRWSGVIVGLFVLFHLSDLTWGWANPDFQGGHPYENTVASLSRWWTAAIYIVANLLLGMHIYHGAWSLFQSLGLTLGRFKSWRRGFAIAFAALIVAGNVSFPIAILTGAVS